MDEITSDLDLFAREGILNFLRAECEVRGATIFYCSLVAMRLMKHSFMECLPLSKKRHPHFRSLGGLGQPSAAPLAGRGLEPWKLVFRSAHSVLLLRGGEVLHDGRSLGVS